MLGDGVDAPLPTAGGTSAVPGAAPSPGAARRRLPAVQQRLVAGQLVQKWVNGGWSIAISVEH